MEYVRIKTAGGFIAFCLASLMGCNDYHNHRVEEGSEHKSKNIHIAQYITPCKNGVHENGKIIPNTLMEKIKKRKVLFLGKNPEDQEASDGTYYYIVHIENNAGNGEEERVVVGCSDNLRDLAAWACETDKSYDGYDCKIESMGGGAVQLGERCEQTDMMVSSSVKKCSF